MFQTRCWATAAAAVVTIGWAGVAAGTILNVPRDFATIQACIDAAVSGVDECVVAPGTYHETINFLGKAITVRSSGGRDVTTIDATGIGGSVVTSASGEGPETVLDGFTITGGNAPGIDGGGGMYNFQSSPTVTNCTFSGNTGYGGGLSNLGSDPIVTNCTFTRNTGLYGGGMYNLVSSPTVTDCTFSGNTGKGTYGGGGGMYNGASSPTLTNCTFNANTANYAGGGMFNSYSSPKVTNCRFNGNTADNGGGMFNPNSTPTVTNCTFTGNKADYGGGMYNGINSSSTIANCTFSGNRAVYSGGGIYNDVSSPTVTQCMFSRNTGLFGGGMYNNHSDPTVTNSTFSGNSGTVFGGGLYNAGSMPLVTNCTFGGNTAAYGSGMYNYRSNSTVTGSILFDDRPDAIVNDGTSTGTVRFSDVQGGLPVGAVDGGGNINLDPMFTRPADPGPDGTWDGVDDDYGDLRLQVGSPCIDAGDPGFVGQPGETDLEGHARVLCSRVDMGAYEFGIGDYDCDQMLDLNDFANWSSCMTGPSTADTAVPHAPGCEAFDFDGNGDVDLLDFSAFQRVLNAP